MGSKDLLSQVVSGYLLFAVCAAGLVGNAVTLWALFFRRKRLQVRAIRWYLYPN